ncbi:MULTISPECIES: hypothetical protein [unclassified Shinella]|uniref:hypothetical protein n=1 Tax=unclassified Shinella TaxID=2643062 RepID=UPI00225C7271|nr:MULTISPECIES: hypothetical protein [unclassified Shinella]MCO5140881.1 hypothetical protein [Shinella sp.]MDC7256428.1 hypothetical protein [Shinella sp. YE25]CAI0339294.1 conserved hypothetical protein [Rhizobiaceae bacterium]CAK7257704.1 conserved protein of unknown function [Shinella sp. WSC3-e]
MLVAFASPEEVDDIWPIFEARMQRACDRYRCDLTEPVLRQMCLSGEAYLMVAHDGERPLMASVWKFYSWPTGIVFRCLCLAGDGVGRWADAARAFAVDAARTGGAKTITASGRAGWGAIFPGAREVYRTYEVNV